MTTDETFSDQQAEQWQQAMLALGNLTCAAGHVEVVAHHLLGIVVKQRGAIDWVLKRPARQRFDFLKNVILADETIADSLRNRIVELLKEANTLHDKRNEMIHSVAVHHFEEGEYLGVRIRGSKSLAGFGPQTSLNVTEFADVTNRLRDIALGLSECVLDVYKSQIP